MEQTKLVPKRRFKVFQNTQAWEQHTISELADRYDNLRVPITASDRMPGNTPYYGANGIQDYVEGFTHCGEFILVAEDGANDLQNYPVQYVNGKVWVNNHAHVLQARSEIADNKFLMNALKQTNIEPYLVGGGRAKLNADVMMKISLRVPELAEQKKIGSFFERLDHLITLHQRKLEKTKALKSAYLSEMFPAEGERVPKRRFAGFTQPWEQRKLGDVVEITMGQSPNSDNYTDNPNDHILVQGNADIKNGYVTPRVWTTQVTKQAEKGDLILSVRAPVGDIGKTDYDVVLGRGVAAIKGNEFIFQSLGRMKQTGYWNKLSTGSTFESINSNDIKDASIMIPGAEEQVKIGSFFKRLDSLITLHQRKLEKLQNLKKAYLNEMFV
ncbi:restriction endonuclease subunit S [Heyndrickxia coagulans]|uniref:Type I restriction-modification system, specificity subunit S n=1 Tax=Heyndrickxia coagulans TaxID=1398 RepID=A0A150K166_HEYCO|nr:restriction endonuclease subunit S [Heyndrickxia coagulans]KYC63222.1 Type I restriction-modification system, specificity subunit S [Heyndrickxia coagulans]